MTTNNQITDRQLEVWIDDANSVLNDGGATVDETSAASTILALCEALQSSRKADSSEPVGYTDAEELRSADNDIWMWKSPHGFGKDIPLYSAQPAPLMPDEMAISDDMNLYQKSFAQGHNACRAAILASAPPREVKRG